MPGCLTALSLLACLLALCAQTTLEEYALRQKIPVAIQKGKPLTVEISCSGNGANSIGIRCTPEVWNVLTNGSNIITAKLKSSSLPNTEVGRVDPFSSGTGFLGYVTNAHYLFYVSGRSHAKASVEITFSNPPPGVTRAEIVVGKTPIDTKP